MISLEIKPIGIIHSQHKQLTKTPAQPVFASGCLGTAEINPEYIDGLKDIEHFSHLYLIYHLHKAAPSELIVKPYLQNKKHGIFATRFPTRPNPIGLSIVELRYKEGNILHLDGIDILDGTPLIDIKPYCSRFDCIQPERSGWYEEVSDDQAYKRGLRGYQGLHS